MIRDGKHARVLAFIAMWFMMMTIVGCSTSPASEDTSPWMNFWHHYTTHFISSEGRVIDYEEGDVTTSEGQAYGLFFALAANDKTAFSKLLMWTQNNLAQGSLAEHLPAWRWGKEKNGQWGVLGKNSASDADLWLAYTLIQAGRLWHKPQYTALGLLLAKHIALEETVTIPGIGPVLLPGRYGFHTTADTYVLNMSYLPLPVLEALGKELPEGPWRQMASELPALIKSTTPKGFVPDWVQYTVDKGFSAAPQGTAGSYGAIRVYLWAGMTNPSTTGSSSILDALWGMRDYLSRHILPPLSVDAATGTASGDGPVGFSAAVIPFLERFGMKFQVGNQMLRLTADMNQNTGLYGNPPRYYDQNLILFAIGWKDKIFRFGTDGSLEPTWQ